MNIEAVTAVVMARGLGTRMRRTDADARLDPAQSRVADSGLKAMIPDAAGRPFLDHIVASLADGGIQRVILVVAPGADLIRDHYRRHPTTRVQLLFATQQQPLGTADAVLAAQDCVGEAPFLVLNADNLYPVAAIRSLVALGRPGLIAFDRDALIELGNFEKTRVAAFATLQLNHSGQLVDLIEKPGQALADATSRSWVSMNLWRFDSQIFDFCRDVTLSARGERELPQAVMLGISRGYLVQAITMHAGVLDLSSRGDIAAVTARLAGATPVP